MMNACRSFTGLRLLAGLAALILSQTLSAQPAQKIAYDIPAQSLESALTQFGVQSKRQLVFDPDTVPARTAPALKGEYTPLEALDILIGNTGLTYSVDGKDTIIVRRVTRASSLSDSSLHMVQADSSQNRNSTGARANRESSEAPESAETKVQEIVVTAQKRVERAQDVPIPLTAVSGQSLIDSNQLRLQDYYSKVPGLNYSPGQWGEPRIAIRGIVTSPYTNPTVGLMIDDIPYGLSINKNGGGGPDIDPGDLDRIEVLRGPQGTLYGASSMGGLLKYVTVDPSVERVSGRVQAGTSSVGEGDDLGYNLRASLNVPLGDTWAVRASAFTRREPGYIDNVQAGQEDTNRVDGEGGRLSTLWQASEDFSLKLSALVQEGTAHGASVVQPALGDLQQSFLNGTGRYERRTQAYSANLAAKFGTVDFVSLTGYSVDRFLSGLDLTGLFGGFATANFSVPNSLYTIDQNIHKLSQEIRFSAPIGPRFEWLVGAFYTDEKINTYQEILAVTPSLVRAGAFSITGGYDVEYEEYAAFANLTIHVSDRFDVQVGGRQSRIREVDPAATPGGIFAGAPTPETITRSNAFTYLLTPRFKITPDIMLYARAASGYRAGGPNFSTAISGPLSPYTPDKTRNYEVGIKGDALDQRLTFDASAYYIDWKNIQLLLTNVFSYYANAGGAKSQGAELSAELRPLRGMTLATWVAWSNAELTEGLPAGGTPVGLTGDRLPYSPRFSGNISLDQEFPLTGGITGFVGAAARYVGERAAAFRPSAIAPQPTMASYTQVDLHGGVRMQSWTLNAFVNNVADERGLTGIYPYAPSSFNYIQPRTIGLALAYQF